MSFPDIPGGYGVPLVDLADGSLPDDTMDYLDDRYLEVAGTPGANGTVLTADNTQPDGVRWDGRAFFTYTRTTAYNFVGLPGTSIAWDAVLLEGTLSGFTTADRITFTCTDAGVYEFFVLITAGNAVATTVGLDFVKNAAVIRTSFMLSNTTSASTLAMPVRTRMAVGDTFSIRARSGATIAASVAAGLNVLSVMKAAL